jgi:hypothetical protein
MDSKELRGLYEAYSEVYAPQEEIDEAVKGESSERRQALAAERRAGHRPKSAKEGENYASHKLAQMAYAKRKRMGEEVEIFDVVLEFLQAEGYAETLEEAEWLMANVIDEKAIEIILGEEQLDELSHDTYRSVAKAQSKKVGDLQSAGNYGAADKVQDKLDRTKRLRKKSFVGPKAPGARNPYAEEYVDEAQEARNNPEKYEAGEKKKYAPVRGEKTPMPPRGNKRREDFEKWYAANVR